jgi:lipopolysaccharide export system protein LptA
MIRRLLIAGILVVVAGPLALAQTAKKKEVTVESDQMEIFESEKRAVFTGKVNARRDDARLTADRLVVLYEDVKQQDGTSKTEVAKLDATGNILIVTNTQKITGQWAKMDVKANKLTVGGNVKVVQGQTILTGETLNVDLDTNKTQMTGGRVKGSFVPQ